MILYFISTLSRRRDHSIYFDCKPIQVLVILSIRVNRFADSCRALFAELLPPQQILLLGGL